MRHRAAIFVLDDKDNALLFHRRKPGEEYYAVPGGGVEPGETPEQAAVRELKEETGLAVTLGEKIGETESDGNYQYFYISKSWSGTPALGGEELEKQSPTNIYDLVWMPIKNISRIDLRGEQKDMLLNYLNR
jgi:8-oxo-dGTP pyrophosphatase MutT (NUDIX family)